MTLIGLAGIAAVNLWGIAESARFLMVPMVALLCAIFGVIVVGLVRSHRAARPDAGRTFCADRVLVENSAVAVDLVFHAGWYSLISPASLGRS